MGPVGRGVLYRESEKNDGFWPEFVWFDIVTLEICYVKNVREEGENYMYM